VISESTETQPRSARSYPLRPPGPPDAEVFSGIIPGDQRTGGLVEGGSYLLVGAPGPVKMVAALQFLHAGVTSGEKGLLLTNASDEGIIGVARAWGFDFEGPWRDGRLQIVGFKDDFELRAIRSVEPEDVVDELDELAGRDLTRIAVDPGSMFLAGGAKSLLGSTFLRWARLHPATVCSTFSVDGVASALPSSADWLVHATTGRMIFEWRAEDLYEITLLKAVPELGDTEEPMSVQLKPGDGLVVPESWPARRGRDRPGVDESRLLLVSLGGSHSAEVETWAGGAFNVDVVSEPLEAVARAQREKSFGGVLIHAPRKNIREAVQACRALRPLTRAAIVFASDDAVRSTDRIHILEAGADDCLSGGIDFRELDLRIRQAIAAGSKPLPEENLADRPESSPGLVPAGSDRGRVPRALFRSELVRRSADPSLKFFCVLDVVSPRLGPESIEEILSQQVRSDEGDLVSSEGGRCAVLLQGAREGQLGPFLDRLRERFDDASGGGKASDVTLGVLSHPADSEKIRSLLGIRRGDEG